MKNEVDAHPIECCVLDIIISGAQRQLFMAQRPRSVVVLPFAIWDECTHCLLNVLLFVMINAYFWMATAVAEPARNWNRDQYFATSRRAAGATSIHLHAKCNFNTFFFSAKCFFLKDLYVKKMFKDVPKEIWRSQIL